MNDPKEKLTQAFAENLTALRTAAGMTQLELADKLHYSDKSISKWERGEALPDTLVLWQIAQIFGVTTDDLLREHTEKPVTFKASDYTNTLIAIVMSGIAMVSLLVFIILWLCGHIVWQVFPMALPVALITLVVLNSVWRGGKGNFLIVSLLVGSIVLLLYCLFYPQSFWQLFLLLIPAELLVWLGFRLNRHKK
ncbi:MAG: helix-turn-helix domain-containing protein [Clostridia bacterium]|nr:helix-turn-helix domain-containing protein [Clostridia bacterium]